MDEAILAPGAALIVWTMIMLIWMFVARSKSLKQAGITINNIPAGSRGQDLAAKLPAQSEWPAHNYMHLLEQPTVFYPVLFIFALTAYGQVDIWLAWAYVGLRVIHSLWQATVNRLTLRGPLFALSSLLLAVLAVRALLVTID